MRFDSQSMENAAQTAFTALKPTLDSAIASWADSNPTGKCLEPSNVGCMAQIVTSRLDGPAGASPVYAFIGAYQGSCGLDYQSALNDSVNHDSVVPSSPDRVR